MYLKSVDGLDFDSGRFRDLKLFKLSDDQRPLARVKSDDPH